MDWTLLTIQILETLKNLCGNWGSWGLAIILLTIVVRVGYFPSSATIRVGFRGDGANELDNSKSM